MNPTFPHLRTHSAFNNCSPRLTAFFAAIVALFFVCFPSQASATTVTYVQQTNYFSSIFTSGTAGAFNNGATEVGMYANTSGNKEVAVWRNLLTGGSGTGSARDLQVGDVFTITVYASSAFGNIGFSLNDNGTQGSSYANRTNGSRLFIQEDGTTGSWYVGNGSTNSTLNYNVSSTARDYTFKVYVTSQSTANIELVAGGVTNRVFNYNLGGSSGANIDAFSMYLKDDYNGSSAANIYWKQTTSVADQGSVDLGYYLASGTFTAGLVANGLDAASTSVVRTNSVNVGGDAGSVVVLSQANTYGGNTTVNANATVRAGNNSAFGTNGTVAVTSGGAVQLSNNITIARALVLNGDGISSGGSLRNIAGANTWSGGVSNNSGARINVDSGTLTIEGNITNANTTLYVGGVSNSTFSGTLTGSRTTGDGALFKDGASTLTLGGNNIALSGNIILRAGTVRAANGGALGSGTVQVGNGATTTTLLIEANGTRSGAISISNASSAGVINVASGLSFTNTGGVTQVGGSDNTTKFGKDGAGTLVLGGTGTYGGQMQVGQGTVVATTSTAFGTNASTSARGIDLGLNVGDTSTVNNVAVLAENGVTISNSIYVAPNTSSALRTIGISGAGSATFNNEIFLGGNLTADSGASGNNLTLSGNLTNVGGLIKTGAGTVTLSGASANTYGGLTTVSAGVLNLNKAPGVNAIAGNLTVGNGTSDNSVKLLLSASNQVANGGGQTVTLSGGTIARGGNVSEVFGNLNLTTASFLDYGAANNTGTLSFGTYAPSALLTVQNFLPGNVLTFGSNLTDSINNPSLFNLGAQGFTSSWSSGTSTFTITAIPEPSTYVAAAGLLALFLWPARRRLIKDAKSILGLRPNGRDRIESYRSA
jgi:autotransporter-associated beta strand protein